MRKKYLFWVDIKNAHEPAFFLPFIKEFGKENFFITARDYAEITHLLREYNYNFSTVGGYYGGNIISKIIGRAVLRNIKLFLKVLPFEYALSHMSLENAWIGKLRGKKVISFTDNDIPQKYSKAQMPFIDYLIIPEAIDPEKFRKMGAKGEIIQFSGFKEDIYISEYTPDPHFLERIPFGEYVIVRPEALKAEYVPKNATTIVPQLLRKLEKENYKVIYLPRYREDKMYSRDLKNVYIPPKPLKGLDLCYYSQVVLTGSGTMAREAACMGVPAVSFFPGKKLLSVDEEMIRRGWLYHSRDPDEIVEYVLSTRRRKPNLDRAKNVKNKVLNKNVKELRWERKKT